MLQHKKLGILGCGTMGEAIMTGLLEANQLKPSAIKAITRRQERADELEEKYKVSGSIQVADLGDAEIILVCLKPQNALSVLRTIDTKGKLLISICAGITISALQ